jgi:hypothetical protein
MKKKVNKNTKAYSKKIVSKLKRSLMKLWSEKVRARDGFSCVYCGKKTGDQNASGTKVKCDAHHYLSRDIKNCPLKFDIRNGITLCPEHHKFSGTFSAHKSPINFYEWLKNTRPEHHKFVLDNTNFRADLDNIDILFYIKECIENCRDLDFNTLVELSTTTTTTTTTTEPSLLEAFQVIAQPPKES